MLVLQTNVCYNKNVGTRVVFYRTIVKGKDCNAMKKKIAIIVVTLVLALASTFVLKDNVTKPCLLTSGVVGAVGSALQDVVKTAEPTDLSHVTSEFAEGMISSLEETMSSPFANLVSICADVIFDTTANLAVGLD